MSKRTDRSCDTPSGVADPASGEPVSAVLSSLVDALVAAGRLDYDLRLAEARPQFAAHGNGKVTCDTMSARAADIDTGVAIALMRNRFSP